MAVSRIAILGSRGIPAKYGGFETFAEEISVRLAEKGVAVTVFCEESGAISQPTYKSVALEYVPARRLGPLTTVLFDLRCLWRARRAFDIVYMLGYGASAFCFLPRIWGTKVWINMDGVEWHRSKWSRLAKSWFVFCEAMAMWTANVVIADAEAIRTHLERRHRRMPECRVIPYGAAIVERDPGPEILDEFDVSPGQYYLIVCRLEPENHVREIIDGFVISDMPYPLLVLGDTDSHTEYVKKLLQVTDERVRFVGTVFDSKKLVALRWHCRGYFHGHSVGGTNPSLLEAMGCGNNIIAHDNAFNREVAGPVAVYFETSSEIAPLLYDLDAAEIYDRSRSTTIERVRSKYTWAAVTDAYLKLVNPGS